MFTEDQINDVTETSLNATKQSLWLAALRGFSVFKANPGMYPNLAATLAAVDGSSAAKIIQAKQLILAYERLTDEVGFGTEALTPTVKSSIDFSNVRDLEQVLQYALDILYDPAAITYPQTSAISGRISDTALFGSCTAGRHRRPCSC